MPKLGINIRGQIGGSGSEIDQNNKVVIKYFPSLPANTYGYRHPHILINNSPQFTVSDKEILLVYIPQNPKAGERGFIQKFWFKPGKGTYGIGGTPTTTNDFEVAFSNQLSLADFANAENKQIIDLGEIGATVPRVILNGKNPRVIVQNPQETFVIFQTLVSGTPKNYLFVGEAGSYGVGGMQSSDNEFQPLGDESVLLKTSQLVNDGDGNAPFLNKISVHNSNDVKQFESERLRINGVSFDADKKQLNVNPLVGGVIFVSDNGNDATAQKENRALPFKTLDAAILAYWADVSIDYIEIISATLFTISTPMTNGSNNRKFDLRSQKSCTVTITRTGNYAYAANNNIQPFNFYLPEGHLRITPNGASGSFGLFGQGTGFLTITATTWTIDANFNLDAASSSQGLIVVKNMTANSNTSGFFRSSAGARNVDITVDTIRLNGANSVFVNSGLGCTLNFKNLIHDNTFSLCKSDASIDHGNISSVAPYVNTTAVEYLPCRALIIRFKVGSVVTSNLFFQGWNNNGWVRLSGECNYVNSDILFRRLNQSLTSITNASLQCKRLFGEKDCTKKIVIESSVIKVDQHLGDFNQVVNGKVYDSPTLVFVGTNYVFTNTAGSDLYAKTDTQVDGNKPMVDVSKGILYTNGKFNRSKVDILENPLNQYYDTTQRQLVIVNEKEEIINKVLDSTKTYIIDGLINLSAGEYVLTDGLVTITGYGFDISGLTKNVAGESVFKSVSGKNLVLKDISVSSGLGEVFDIQDIDGTHAIEMNDVNFAGCASLGKIRGYRQITGQTFGMYSVKEGLTLSGNMNGISLSKLHVRDFGVAGSQRTIFKKDNDTLFSGRFVLDCNTDFKDGGNLSNFVAANFSKPKTFKIINSEITRNGVTDDTQNYTGEITAFSSVSDWSGNNGLKNSHEHPYGIKTDRMKIFADDAAASIGNIEIGQVYIEASTGYFKTRIA